MNIFNIFDVSPLHMVVRKLLTITSNFKYYPINFLQSPRKVENLLVFLQNQNHANTAAKTLIDLVL